ncbi:Glycosyltransferase [Vulgatibacter incomptus]|uniref:Glycosyltransferase n=1 Tax=Vulgatibacter incomptus TaxID=1391653 RepID=A0A0K1P8V5_9BACT|nr:Glycosyltransferase [Vulgatibacter incomptus]
MDSVAAQTVKPALWVVVDDGSTDDTPRILAEYQERLPYLRVVRRENRGHRAVGPGVIEAFYAGLETVDLDSFDFLCKLDVDLVLPERYFEILLSRMEAEPRLGTCSGKPWFDHPVTGKRLPEACGDEMSAGFSKFYRVSCFREIGGFVRQVMWDGIDCHRARMLGWIARAYNDEEVRVLHLRPMGSSGHGILEGRVRHGFGQYFMGSSPLFVTASAVSRLAMHPRLTGSVAMLWGYYSSAAKGLPRYDDPEFRKFLRSYQRLSLAIGKRRAIAKLNRERAGIWEARHTLTSSTPTAARARASAGGGA